MIFFILAIVLGVAAGLLLPYNLTSATLPYVAVAIVAALDSVVGGILAYFNKRFNMSIFITGLFSNAFLAVLIAYLGNILGISLYFAVIVVFGVRIFNNMATLRRTTLDIYFVKRIKEKERKLHLLALTERTVVEDLEEDNEYNDAQLENKEKTEEKEGK